MEDNVLKKLVKNVKIKFNKKDKSYPSMDYAFSDEELHENISSEEINLRDGADDEFAMKSIEDLLKEFDIDEIDRNTDYFDDKGKTR